MINSLETFLETTSLKNNPNYVEALFKTANSKNITIEEWNTFINQLTNVISQNAQTYLGFEKTLDALENVKLKLDAVDADFSTVSTDLENITEDLNDIRTNLNSATDTLTEVVSNLENIDSRVSGFEDVIIVDDDVVKFSKPVETDALKLLNTVFTETYLKKLISLLNVMNTGTGTRLYGVTTDGTPTFKTISTNGISTYSVLTRDGKGNCGIAYPSEDLHISNKKYVDDMCQDLKEYIGNIIRDFNIYTTFKFNNTVEVPKPDNVLPWVKLTKLGGMLTVVDSQAIINDIIYLTVNGEYIPLPNFTNLYDNGFGWSIGSGNSTVYNYVDFENGLFYKPVTKYVFTGSETWNGSPDVPGQFYTDKIFTDALTVKNSNGDNIVKIGTCTHFKFSENGAYGGRQENNITLRGSRIWVYAPDFNSNTSAFKNYLKEQYSNGTPVTLFYQIKDVTTVPFECDELYFKLPDGASIFFENSVGETVGANGELLCMWEVANAS